MKLGFIQIGQSQVTLWHRPQSKDIAYLKTLQNISMIVTLLAGREDPNDIFKQCEFHGIKSFHIPLNGAN